MQKPTFEDYMKLIGELGRRSSGSNISLGFTPAAKWVMNERDGYDYSDWGYVVGAKVPGTDREITAQDKNLLTAMQKLVAEIMKYYSEAVERRREDETKALTVMKVFNERFTPEAPPSSGSPYR